MKKRFFIFSLLLLIAFILTGCSKKPLVIWVGAESVDFYQEKADEYIAKFNESGEKFPCKIVVKGVDTASAAATFLDDTEAGADIFTIAHDNIGKLTTGSSAIAPVQSEKLLAQINADNPELFLDVIKNTVDGTTYTFGVPYISQALVLYYNKEFLTETDCLNWESIWQVAKDKNSKAVTLLGDDGYNASFLLLSRKADDNSTTVKIYQNADIENVFCSGDDTVAIHKWGQRFFGDKNGASWKTDSGWEVELKDKHALTLIGGAWNFKAAKAALGSNLGITTLPSFTITEEDAYGSIKSGTKFNSGTFTDCKVFVMKKNSKYAKYLEGIIQYFTSIEVQEQSFEKCANLPAYKNAVNEFEAMSKDTLEAQLAACQLKMFETGIPQPFGYKPKFNFYFYSKGGPELFKAILSNTNDAYKTDEAIINELHTIENIWKTGAKPK